MDLGKTLDQVIPAERDKAVNLGDPSLYINRELSWLRFNLRVLEEALDERHPLLERVKFLAIFGSNLDEFFMVRVSGLHWQVAGGALEAPPDGKTPAEQLAVIRRELLPLLAQQTKCWQEDLLPKLREATIRVRGYDELKNKQRKLLRHHFETKIFPALTPLAFDASHPFPHISNLSINLAVVVNDPVHGERFARLKVPSMFPRLLRIPSEEKAESFEGPGLADVRSNRFVWIEDVIVANLDMLLPGVEIVAAYPFRVTRDADPDIEEDEASDLLVAIQEGIEMRQFGTAVRIEVNNNMPDRIRRVLLTNLALTPEQLYAVDGPIGLADLMELTRVDLPELKDPPFVPSVPPALASGANLFSVISRRNVLLYHPYDGFSPVVEFLSGAAKDPDVLAIKQTLYRVGANSPIVHALMEARKNGKEVTVLLELKARFDEVNNIGWARELERAGVHVVYGVVGLKTHAKMCLVARREGDGITRYVHLSTGNYSPATARIYTDMGFFTSQSAIASDVSVLFNALTGYSNKDEYRKLLVAPRRLRRDILDRVERVTEGHRQRGDGYVAFKLNALTDTACIQALYRASQAGVRVDLQVRGICCLRPGLPGISEHITVTSLVGRFLEHSRIYYFRNGEEEQMLMGSADLMPRNLDGRVEILFPLEDSRMRQIVRDSILFKHLKDTRQVRRMSADGIYHRVQPPPGEPELDSQAWMLEHRGVWNTEE